MVARTYGEAVGLLIKQRRLAGGFTQLSLAIEAFEDETKVRRIVELENGQVPRPHRRTLTPIFETLNITQAEIDACTRLPTISAEQREQIGLSASLVERLSEILEVQVPDTTFQELTTFLLAKAEDLKALAVRMSGFHDAETEVRTLLNEAQLAINTGAFAQADRLLLQCELVQQTKRTIIEIRRQADIRAVKASTSLLAGDVEGAYLDFEYAAQLFDHFDILEGARKRHSFQDQLHWHGRRFGNNALALSVKLGEKNLRIFSVEQHAEDCAETFITTALAMMFQGMRLAGVEALPLLRAAASYFKEAISIWESRNPRRWRDARIKLAIARRYAGTRMSGWPALRKLREAARDYESLGAEDEFAADKQERARLLTNHSTALVEIGRSVNSMQKKKALFAAGAERGEAALSLYRDLQHPENLAISLNNAGRAYAELGAVLDGSDAMTALYKGLSYYFEAIGDDAKRLRPFMWAMTSENIGTVYEDLAAKDVASRASHLQSALGHLSAALEVYRPDVDGFFYDKCSSARDRVCEKLGAA